MRTKSISHHALALSLLTIALSGSVLAETDAGRKLEHCRRTWCHYHFW